MSGDPYVYPGRWILRNKLGLNNSVALDKAERLFSANRVAEGVPHGDFDLAHLRAIHRHLFQAVYGWAGEIRTVEIAEGRHRFMFRRFIGAERPMCGGLSSPAIVSPPHGPRASRLANISSKSA